MERVKILSGIYQGMYGDATYLPDQRLYHVSIPDRKRPELTDYYPPESVKIIKSAKRSILENKEFISLQSIEHVQIIGCKVSCSSVWCPECFKRKGGSKRVADRLSKLKYNATRHIVLTVDLKKFNGSGQLAFETLREKGAVHQFIHNLKRTSKVNIVDWVWVLEWHSAGDPHWHLFIQTEKGKKGQIGNKALLKHWRHGLVFESYIKSIFHWKRFTDYFGSNGYFDPNSKCETKDKSHQLELPEWAKEVTYMIRKTGSMVKNKSKKGNYIEEVEDNKEEDKKESNKICKKEVKTYREILTACGQETYCQIRRGEGYLSWTKLNIPYKYFKEYPGEYIKNVGYFIQMSLDAFFIFLGLYDYDLTELEKAA